MQWLLKTFQQLNVNELYKIMQLRIDIFVVEQNCPYSDLDGKDNHPEALHLFTLIDHQVAAYLRVLAPGISYQGKPSLGRVITNSKFRGQGLGHKLLEEAVRILDQKWPNQVCHISAQSHLQNYYAQQGFITVGEGYLEDDIPHVGMERQPFSTKV